MSQNVPLKPEQEILTLLDMIMKKTMAINQSISPQIHKDASIRILTESIKSVLDELSESKINQLVYEEFKKKNNKHL